MSLAFIFLNELIFKSLNNATQTITFYQCAWEVHEMTSLDSDITDLRWMT